MKQTMIICGYARREGVSKRTGQQYSFVNVDTLVPRRQDSFVTACGGYELREYGVPDDVLQQLQRIEKFPSEHTCQLEIGRDSKVRIIAISPVREAAPPQSKTA